MYCKNLYIYIQYTLSSLTDQRWDPKTLLKTSGFLQNPVPDHCECNWAIGQTLQVNTKTPGLAKSEDTGSEETADPVVWPIRNVIRSISP